MLISWFTSPAHSYANLMSPARGASPRLVIKEREPFIADIELSQEEKLKWNILWLVLYYPGKVLGYFGLLLNNQLPNDWKNCHLNYHYSHYLWRAMNCQFTAINPNSCKALKLLWRPLKPDNYQAWQQLMVRWVKITTQIGGRFKRWSRAFKC